jgi:hypothetical protein
MKTLKVNNGSSAKFGNVSSREIAKLSDSVETDAIKQTLKLTIMSDEKETDAQASTRQKTSLLTNKKMSVMSSPTLIDLVKGSISNSTTTVSLISRSKGSKNSISSICSHNTIVSMPASVAGKISNLSIKNASSSDKIELYDVKFTSYERDTGISQERPEILMLTSFLPIYKDYIDTTSVDVSNVSLMNTVTDSNGIQALGFSNAGQFLNAQFNSRLLSKKSIEASLETIDREKATEIKSILQKSVNEAKGTILSLLQKVLTSTNVGEKLDTRNATIDIRSIVDNKLTALFYTSLMSTQDRNLYNVDSIYNVNSSGLSSTISNNTTTIETLVEHGHKQSHVDSSYSATKIWIQLLQDYKVSIQSHSDGYANVVDPKKASDSDSTNIVKSSLVSSGKFGSRHVQVVLPTMSTLRQANFIQSRLQLTVVNDFINSYDSLQKNVDLSDQVTKVCLLLNNVVQEFKYSYSLSDPQFKSVIAKNYGYVVSDPSTSANNINLFDNIIGVIPNNITEFPVNNVNSLMSVAQQVVGNVAVLPLEKRYIESNSSVATPGKSFYVDDALRVVNNKFNTDNAKSRVSSLLTTMNSFVDIAIRLNLFCFTQRQTRDVSGYNPVFDTKEYLNTIVLMLTEQVQKNNNVNFTLNEGSVITTDPAVSVYSHAARNKKLLTLLFMMTLATGQSRDLLIDEVVAELVKDFSTNTTEVSDNSGTIFNVGELQLKQLLRNGAFSEKMRAIVLTTMMYMSQTSSPGTSAFSANRTYYSGNHESLLMLQVFDLVCTLVDLYSNMHMSKITTFDVYDSQHTFIVRKSYVTPTSFNRIHLKLEQERELSQQTSLVILSTLNTQHDLMSSFVNDLDSTASLTSLRSLSEFVQNDRMNLLLDEQQLSTVMNVLNDIYDKIGSTNLNEENVYENVDDVSTDEKLKSLMFSVLNAPEFKTYKGSNKKIFTIGIPLGFTKKFKHEKIDASSKSAAFVNKVRDIVKIVVYKTDLEYSDIVFKPQTFLFELSRYPVRNSSVFVTSNDTVTLENIINFLPTRNVSSLLLDRSNDKKIEYYDTSKLPDDLKNNAVKAFSNDDYSFLTLDEKKKVLQNHVMSFLLEAYIKLMTGIDVSEHTFHFDPYENTIESPRIEEFINKQVQNINSKFAGSNKSLLSSNPNANLSFFPTSVSMTPSSKSVASSKSSLTSSQIKKMNVTPKAAALLPVDESLSNVSTKSTGSVVEAVKAITNASRSLSTLSDSRLALKRVLQPKQFDRVLTMLVDPDDFMIDLNETLNTNYGKQTLELLISQGKIVMLDSQSREYTATSFSSTDVYRYKEKTLGELSLERYFVSIQSYSE